MWRTQTKKEERIMKTIFALCFVAVGLVFVGSAAAKIIREYLFS